ncbi:MAG: glucose-1-phosphate cytidylyltransferase [marine bacterium B5-7]|nr:MAG: glucose-1-phosphate cytidylyltransferase [marine bacterium B5-7]
MKVVLLAGGFGTRLAEYTDVVPKPMVRIGQYPILLHIMRHYAAYEYKDFLIALGYKGEVIKEYFLNYYSLNADFTVNLGSGDVTHHNTLSLDWNVTLVDTGADSMTGGRVGRMRDYVDNERFLLTYGDGLSDVNIDSLLDFHRSHGKLVTVTAVRPAARFGDLSLEDSRVASFSEKPRMKEGWINGGFFVMEPEFLDFISNDATILEKEPLELAAQKGELMAYRHEGFWQCMDTKRDHDHLSEMWDGGNAPWVPGI